MIDRSKALAICSIICKVALVITLVMALYCGWQYWKYWQLHPTSVYEYTSWSGEMPDELAIKIQYHNVVRHWVYLGLGLAALTEVVSYYRKKEGHWVTWLLDKAKGINKYMEGEE